MSPNTEWLRLVGSNAFKYGVPRSEAAGPSELQGYWLAGWDAAARGEEVLCEPIECRCDTVIDSPVFMGAGGHGFYYSSAVHD